MQKAILARELDGAPPLIIASNPTAGLDIAAVKLVHETLLEQASEGAAVVLISEDLDELFQLCDRIAVIREGNIRGIFDAASNNERLRQFKRAIGFLMSADLVDYLEDSDGLDNDLANKLNSYPYIDVLRDELSETDVPLVMNLARNSPKEAVRELAYTLLHNLLKTPGVRAFLEEGWRTHSDFTTKQSILWRLLDCWNLDDKVHREYYQFVKEHWTAFLKKQSKYLGGQQEVIQTIRQRFEKIDAGEYPPEKAWAYLCSSFASENWPEVRQLVEKFAINDADGVVSCIAKDLLKRPELRVASEGQNRS